MKRSIKLERELKIKNVKPAWDTINSLINKRKSEKTPLKIYMNDVESIDTSGFQLILYLFTQADLFPNKFSIEKVSDFITKYSDKNGYKIITKEDDK